MPSYGNGKMEIIHTIPTQDLSLVTLYAFNIFMTDTFKRVVCAHVHGSHKIYTTQRSGLYNNTYRIIHYFNKWGGKDKKRENFIYKMKVLEGTFNKVSENTRTFNKS